MPSHGLVKKRRIPDDSSDEEEEAKRKEAARREEDSSDEELFTDKGPSTPHSMKLMSAIESSQAATSSGAAALDAATTKSKLPKKRWSPNSFKTTTIQKDAYRQIIEVRLSKLIFGAAW